MKKIIDGFLSVVSLTTRLPIKTKAYDFKLFPVFFPLVGVLLSTILGMTVYGLLLLKIKPLLIVFAVVIIQYMLANIFHFDGFLDVCDAMISYKDKDQRLKIMQDPHHGSFALFLGSLYIVLKVIVLFLILSDLYTALYAGNLKILNTVKSLLNQLSKMKNPNYYNILFILMLYPFIGRVSAVFLGGLLNPCKTTGLAAQMGKQSKQMIVYSGFLYFGLLVFLYIVLSAGKRHVMNPGSFLLLITLPVIIAVYIVYCPFKRFLNGLTGDAYGCVVEVAELFFLLGYYGIVA